MYAVGQHSPKENRKLFNYSMFCRFSSKAKPRLWDSNFIFPLMKAGQRKTWFYLILEIKHRFLKSVITNKLYSSEYSLVLNVQSFLLFCSLYLLSWPPRSSPWSSCRRQQPGQWAAPADTQPGQQLPTEPLGGRRCSDLKHRAEREKGQKRESLIIHSCRAKISTTVTTIAITIIWQFWC